MAQITQTAKGLNLSDTIKFSFQITGEAGVDPKAAYWEKFRAYFTQVAAAVSDPSCGVPLPVAEEAV